MSKQIRQWLNGLPLFLLALMVLTACGNVAKAASSATDLNQDKKSSPVFSFNLVPSPGIAQCLPHAKGHADIFQEPNNQKLQVSVEGLIPNTGYALFVIQLANKPFGVAWYQGDFDTNGEGKGSVTVRGIFSKETFSVSTGGPTVTFKPTHQFQLGLWFGETEPPFQQGCEPGKTSPVVTPFDGDHVAGVQALNTANFPDNAGPLSHVS